MYYFVRLFCDAPRCNHATIVARSPERLLATFVELPPTPIEGHLPPADVRDFRQHRCHRRALYAASVGTSSRRVRKRGGARGCRARLGRRSSSGPIEVGRFCHCIDRHHVLKHAGYALGLCCAATQWSRSSTQVRMRRCFVCVRFVCDVESSRVTSLIPRAQAAWKVQNWRLINTTLYCTLEPCPMCLAAMQVGFWQSQSVSKTAVVHH